MHGTVKDNTNEEPSMFTYLYHLSDAIRYNHAFMVTVVHHITSLKTPADIEKHCQLLHLVQVKICILLLAVIGKRIKCKMFNILWYLWTWQGFSWCHDFFWSCIEGKRSILTPKINKYILRTSFWICWGCW